jgi:hypothetical protein
MDDNYKEEVKRIKTGWLLHSMLGTNSSISQGTAMQQGKIEIYNYLDEHAVINNSIIEVFSVKKLQTAFPEIDETDIKGF